jgi:DNA-binding IclR family transcriptional regulator
MLSGCKSLFDVGWLRRDRETSQFSLGLSELGVNLRYDHSLDVVSLQKVVECFAI